MSPPSGIRTPPSSNPPNAVPVSTNLPGKISSVAGIDEISDFAVAEAQRADARADVRLEVARASERQEADERRQRHDAKFQLLSNLEVVLVDHVEIHRGNGALVEAHARSEFNVAAECDVPLAEDLCRY